MNTTPMMARAIELGGKEWTSPDGQKRVYLNHWTEMPELLAAVGLEIERYGTGNVRRATLRGAKISNSRATQLLAAGNRPAYVDCDGLHADGPTMLLDALAALLAQPPAEPEPVQYLCRVYNQFGGGGEATGTTGRHAVALAAWDQAMAETYRRQHSRIPARFPGRFGGVARYSRFGHKPTVDMYPR